MSYYEICFLLNCRLLNLWSKIHFFLNIDVRFMDNTLVSQEELRVIDQMVASSVDSAVDTSVSKVI